ncbi:hypothetical protein BJ965_002938 [Streptomyces luteogriseus]|uniref:Uncharacterized protein n=1 Tax=Streptomyces luteogriseus TaxID=68233 RepID=A0A7W7GGN7_9ACTN|nr:hypothetical protein [Streptomyces luteogriseus]
MRFHDDVDRDLRLGVGGDLRLQVVLPVRGGDLQHEAEADRVVGVVLDVVILEVGVHDREVGDGIVGCHSRVRSGSPHPKVWHMPEGPVSSGNGALKAQAVDLRSGA